MSIYDFRVKLAGSSGSRSDVDDDEMRFFHLESLKKWLHSSLTSVGEKVSSPTEVKKGKGLVG